MDYIKKNDFLSKYNQCYSKIWSASFLQLNPNYLGSDFYEHFFVTT